MLVFFSVTTPKQALALLKEVARMVEDGEKTSIHSAIKSMKKDRKTIDCFKNIYYLDAINPALLKEVCIYELLAVL